MAECIYTALFPFGGIGAGALGFLQAQHPDASFRILGGLDFDALACKDFEYLTGVPSWCVDVNDISPEQLRELYGVTPPDVVFLSPPCKGGSSLLSNEDAESEKYQRMNWLAYTWISKMLAAWGDQRPRLVLFENVPRLTARAPKMLAEVKALLEAAGYVLHEGYHDCGVLGGLAQHRRRYLMIARHRSVEHLLYQPPEQRVRGCGEELGKLPLPGDPAAGPMHQLPRISWLNAIRLALIPAGGDWRDLPGVVPEGKRRGSVFKRKAVEAWEQPTDTIAGPGSNGVENVSDPRLAMACLGASTHLHLYRVGSGGSPVGTVTGATRPGQGAPSIADPRLGAFHGSYGVRPWQAPAPTLTAGASVSTGSFSVADPRLALGYATRDGTLRITFWGEPASAVTGQSGRTGHCSGGLVADPRLPLGCTPRAGAYGVTSWVAPLCTVTGSASPDNGAFVVADPRAAWLRLPRAYDHAYRSLRWGEPSFTVAGKTSVGCGAYAVSDPRLWGCIGFGADNPGRHWNKYRVGSWASPAGTVVGALQIGSGAPSVADPRAPELPAHLQGHEVMTWLEAAATLEGLPGAEAPRRSKRGAQAPRKAKLSPWLDPTRPRPFPTIVIAADGTWHRPLTTLELAVLQGLPATVRGRPLQLAGNSSEQREHIGNAVPVGASRAIAEQMLKTLVAADEKGMFLSSTPIWVSPSSCVLEASP